MKTRFSYYRNLVSSFKRLSLRGWEALPTGYCYPYIFLLLFSCVFILQGCGKQKIFIRDKETNYMFQEFVISKVIEVIFYEIKGEPPIKMIKRKMGLDELSRIGKRALKRTRDESGENLDVLNKIREVQDIEPRDPSELDKDELYHTISEKVEVDKESFG